MAHHDPFKHLGPLPWDILSSNPDNNDPENEAPENNRPKDGNKLAELVTTTLSNAQILIDSIPSPTLTASSSTKKTTGRARSQTDSAVRLQMQKQAPSSPGRERATTDPAFADLLRKEWKDVKVNPRDNPLGISVYKLSARDGKGAWFARRSIHANVASFEKWRLGLRREFASTSTVRSGDEAKSVRGLGAEKRVGRVNLPGVGGCDVFLVSVRFPGPTTPRDFVTGIITPDDNSREGEEREEKRGRQFMLVSRPVDHPSCPPRTGFIRGTYESVEVIREVPVTKLLRRTRSSVSMTRDQGLLSDGGRDGNESSPEAGHGDEKEEMAIEWLMVTRSDPGGSVPRFMVEKGTPGGIISDAGKFITWLESKSMDELAGDINGDGLDGEVDGQVDGHGQGDIRGQEIQSQDHAAKLQDQDTQKGQASKVEVPSGFYGMIASALEAAGSVVMTHLPLSSTNPSDMDTDTEDNSDTSSIDYASAEEDLIASALQDIKDSPSLPGVASSIRSTISTSSHTTTPPSVSSALSPQIKQEQHDKELARLRERQRRAHEKMIKNQEKQAAKRTSQNENEKDAQEREKELAKLKEKHDREVAKHEHKFQRDIRRLAEKRESERRKAEERARKVAEREEKKNLSVELDKVRAERDVALREMEILREQVGALQAQNTMLVARMGRDGKS